MRYCGDHKESGDGGGVTYGSWKFSWLGVLGTEPTTRRLIFWDVHPPTMVSVHSAYRRVCQSRVRKGVWKRA